MALSSSPVTKWLCKRIQFYRKLWNLQWGPAERCEIQLACLMCHVDCPYPSLPSPLVTCLIYGESYVYWMQRNNSSGHSVATTLFCDTLVLPISSSFHLWLHLCSSSYPEKELNFLLAITEPIFCWKVCWISRVVCQLSVECLWLPLMKSSLPPDHHGLEPDGPLWVNLALSAFGCLFQDTASSWLFWEPSDLGGLNQNSPPWPAVQFHLSDSVG